MRARFSHPWYVNDTGTPAVFRVVGNDGELRTDLASATIRVVDRGDGEVLVDDEAISQAPDGVFTWYFTSGETSEARKFSCRLRITTDAGGVIVTPYVDGEVRA